MVDPTDALPAGSVIVTCATSGFRRAGIAHPARMEYPPEHFAPATLAILQAEPRLVMQVVPGAAPSLHPGNRKR